MSKIPIIDMNRIKILAEVLSKLKITPMDLFDPRFYPPPNDPLDKVFMYFLVMVAIDHRLSRPGKLYQAVIDGEKLKGADLLYRLGMKMYSSNLYFFTPSNLSKIDVQSVLSWLSIGEVSPPDPDVRAALLRDLGMKILKLFDGDALEILRISGGYLRKDDGAGLLDILRMFKAYSDPVEKKAMLLAKFLSYRGILSIVDINNVRVPVDNHLTRIALRLGVVVLEKELEDKVFRGESVSYDEDILIRYSVREAYRHLSAYSKISPFHLDDFLWNFGRSICIKDTPRCSICSLREYCKAYETKVFLNEHNYINTWYY